MRIIDWSSNVCSSDLWWPFAWLSNRLDIDRLVIPRATLHKLPRLNPSEREGPILPGFDIRLMQFSVGRLTIDRRVTGRSEERRCGTEWFSTCRSWWEPLHQKKKIMLHTIINYH